MITSKHSLEPIIDEHARVLILGAPAGDQSLRTGRYYEHPSNQFWRILAMVYATDVPDVYEDRVAFLQQRGIALWDARFTNDSGGHLNAEVYNDIAKQLEQMLKQYPGVTAVGFNGIDVGNLFRRHFVRAERVVLPDHVRTEILPSSMAVRGKFVISLEDKAKRWRSFLLQ